MTDFPIGLVSQDGLWAWDGKKWVHIPRLDLKCGRCESIQSVAEGKKDFKCMNGHQQDFVACQLCRSTFQRAHERRDFTVRCAQCGTASDYVTTVSAWSWAADQLARGLPLGGEALTSDPDQRVLRGFTLAASGGTRIATGSPCEIDFSASGITIRPSGQPDETLPYEQVHAVQVTGSTTRGSAGVFGGGFGIAGAAEGMLAASVINSLTARTSMYTVARIAATSSEYVFASHSVDSNAVQMLLTPVYPRIRQAQAAAASTPPLPPQGGAVSVADELTKLAQLRDSGVLSDAEFASAKARLLGNL